MTTIPFSLVACRVFRVEMVGPTVVVTPICDLEEFRFQDVHHDVGRVTDLLLRPEVNGLVIDLSGRYHSGSILIDILTSFCRTVQNRAVLVGVSPEMDSRLDDLRLRSLWPILPTLAAGLAHFEMATAESPAARYGMPLR